jgi:hypothetical protein
MLTTKLHLTGRPRSPYDSTRRVSVSRLAEAACSGFLTQVPTGLFVQTCIDYFTKTEDGRCVSFLASHRAGIDWLCIGHGGAQAAPLDPHNRYLSGASLADKIGARGSVSHNFRHHPHKTSATPLILKGCSHRSAPRATRSGRSARTLTRTTIGTLWSSRARTPEGRR